MITGIPPSFSPAQIRAVVSDLMCTLFNPDVSEAVIEEWARHMDVPHGPLSKAMDHHEYEAGIGNPGLMEDWIALVFEQATIPAVDVKMARAYAHKLGEITASSGHPYPYVYELITTIRESGRTFSILSTVSYRGRLAAKSLNFDKPHVDDAIFSNEVHAMKPDPVVYDMASKRINQPPEHCLFIDDHPEYAAAAIDHGMVGVTVLHSEGHAARMIREGATTREAINAQGIITIDRIEELGELLGLPELVA